MLAQSNSFTYFNMFACVSVCTTFKLVTIIDCGSNYCINVGLFFPNKT